MGIPGILKEIGKGERIALSKLAVEHLERTQRPLRIAIDAAIWNFQTQAGQGGKNPALRTLYYKLLRLLALPIHPVFVYDGKNKPLVKRGRTVTRWGTCVANESSKRLVSLFRFPYHMAPGEAEAECALLQRRGIVDVVMSQDGDAIMFGSKVTLRDWSKEGTRGNKQPTHVNLLDLKRIKDRSGLDPAGMVLVALLSGGDYDQNGVAGFGPGLACEIARAGFGTDLLELLRKNDDFGLTEWRDRLQFELETNESGFFKRKHKSLKIPEDFPDRTIFGYYVNPAVSDEEGLDKLRKKLSKSWDSDIDIPEFRQYVGETFDWLYKPGAWKFVRGMAPALLANKLRRGMADSYLRSVDQITERRQHFINDGIPELRVTAVPAVVVGLDLDAEEDSPEYLASLVEEQDNEGAGERSEDEAFERPEPEENTALESPTKKRKSPPWNPLMPEKMWIAETIVQLGAPTVVEDWQQAQRDLMADPKKFASRKCRTNKTKVVRKAQIGAMEQYLSRTQHNVALSTVQDNLAASRAPLQQQASWEVVLRTPTKQIEKVTTEARSPNLKDFFKPSKPAERTINPALEDLSSRDKSADLLSDSRSKSFTDFIEIASSPIPIVESGLSISDPVTPRKLANQTGPVATSDVELPELPSSVTRRKRGKKQPNSLISESQGDQPPIQTIQHQSRPIRDFFRPVNRLERQCTNAREGSNGRDTDMPQDFSTGLPTGFAHKGTHALPRDSLPGTWREVELDEPIVSTKPKRSLRISYVDLVDS